jgi:hypothetical protein
MSVVDKRKINATATRQKAGEIVAPIHLHQFEDAIAGIFLEFGA